MRSQGKGREGSQQDPGAGKAWGGCGWSCGREHSDVGAGLRSATGGLWSHLMVQLQPHLRVGVAHGSICGRAGAPLGGVPRASEGQRLGPGDVVTPALHVGFRRTEGSLGLWCVFCVRDTEEGNGLNECT